MAVCVRAHLETILLPSVLEMKRGAKRGFLFSDNFKQLSKELNNNLHY
jgi:hypothetical protein